MNLCDRPKYAMNDLSGTKTKSDIQFFIIIIEAKPITIFTHSLAD